MMKLNKILVFDVDGTLLHRKIEKIANLAHDFTSNGTAIYGKTNVVKADQSKVTPSMKERYNFDEFNWAMKAYERYKSNKK